MSTELPPRPSPEQVQAAYIWLERAQQDTDMWLNAMDVLFAWTKAHHRRVQDNDCSSAEILAAELAHVREELRAEREALQHGAGLLAWCIRQFQGDSGAGESYWQTIPQYKIAQAWLSRFQKSEPAAPAAKEGAI